MNILKCLIPFVSGLCLMSSCEVLDTAQVPVEGDSPVNISIEALSWSGYSSEIAGYGSSDGGIVNFPSATMRYILEVYDTAGGLVLRHVEGPTLERNIIFSDIRLLAREYDFVVWADFCDSESAVSHYYDTESNQGLQEISIKSGYAGNNDLRDAYTNTKRVDLTESSQTVPITLYRPFAKVRIVATDADTQQAALVGAKSMITYDRPIADTYNALTKRAGISDNAPSGYVAAQPIYDDYGTAMSPIVSTSQTLAWDYLFVTTPEMAYDLTFTIFDKNNTPMVLPTIADPARTQMRVSGVPLRKNALSTLHGRILSIDENP